MTCFILGKPSKGDEETPKFIHIILHTSLFVASRLAVFSCCKPAACLFRHLLDRVGDCLVAPVTPNIDIFCFVVTMIFTVNTLVVFLFRKKEYVIYAFRCVHRMRKLSAGAVTLQRVSGGRRGASVHDGIIIPIDLLMPRVTTAVKQRIFHFPHERLFYCYCLAKKKKKKESGTTICFFLIVTFCSTDCRCGPTFPWVSRAQNYQRSSSCQRSSLHQTLPVLP